MFRRFGSAYALAIAAVLAMVGPVSAAAQDLGNAQGEMAGEPTSGSIILQSRLTASYSLVDGDVPGAPGVARFEVSKSPDFADSVSTDWMEARPESDFIVKAKIDGLDPGTRYHYRLVFGADRDDVRPGDPRSFRTLPDPTVDAPVSFVVVTGMNYSKFHDPETGHQGPDKHLGYPALEAMGALAPDFFVGTGDNVYYDHPREGAAQTVAEMRRKWHEQFVQPRYVQFFSKVATFWEKDDHDYRYDDADREGDRLPTHEDGVAIFREQVPVVDPADPGAPTYRTHRMGRLLQVWFTEGRDYRSPNDMPDGPRKTLWGQQQRDWLKRTLTESDAPFKVVISPTPMVGPDDARKSDNHVNQKGFRHEGDAFIAWLKEEGLLDRNFYVVCGDRHWQYHSIHPSGLEEFSTGALVDANAREGRLPGDPASTDPEALVKQPYTYPEPTGGFLHVRVEPGDPPALVFTFYDDEGKELYRETKTALTE